MKVVKEAMIYHQTKAVFQYVLTDGFYFSGSVDNDVLNMPNVQYFITCVWKRKGTPRIYKPVK